MTDECKVTWIENDIVWEFDATPKDQPPRDPPAVGDLWSPVVGEIRVWDGAHWIVIAKG